MRTSNYCYNNTRLPVGILVACCLPIMLQGFVSRSTTSKTAFLSRRPSSLVHLSDTKNKDSSKETSINSNINAQSKSDPPLSSVVHIPNFTLASTKEDVLELNEGQRLVCLGDVHGDLQGLQNFLEIAGVYNREDNKWIGDDTILVQCGDVLDRGSQELACFQLLSELSQQAVLDGGKIICLFGNHEALNAMGLFQYATGDFEYEAWIGKLVDEQLNTTQWRTQYVRNQPARWATYEPGGLLADSLLQNFKVAVQVGKTVCVHAGLTSDHLQEYGGLEGMNAQAQAWIANETPSNVTYNHQGQYDNPKQPWLEAEVRQASYINSVPPFLGGGIGAPSPIWMRDYSSPNDLPPKNPRAQKMIDDVLKELHSDRMVMGHTVQQQINCALDGKAWRIDVGVSRGVMGGTPEVLQVVMVNGTEVVSVLTKQGAVAGKERQILAMVNMF